MRGSSSPRDSLPNSLPSHTRGKSRGRAVVLAAVAAAAAAAVAAMPKPPVWDDFRSIDDRNGLMKHNPGGLQLDDVGEAVYARWECPYCKGIVEVKRDKNVLRHKAGACARHLNKCLLRDPADLRGKKPQKTAHATAVPAPHTALLLTYSGGEAPAPSETDRVVDECQEGDIAALRRQLELERRRAARWKKRARDYHSDTAVAAPESDDDEAAVMAKRQRLRLAWAGGEVEGVPCAWRPD